MSKLTKTLCLAAATLTLCTVFGTPVHAMGRKPRSSMRLPRRLMFGTEILEEIHRQTGWRYAYPSGVLIHQLDAGVFKGEADPLAVAARLAPDVAVRNDILVFSESVDANTLAELETALKNGGPDQRRLAAYRIGGLKSPEAIPALYPALSDEDSSVRHHALRSLDRLERDFRSHAPAGRVSIFRLEPDFHADIFTALMDNAVDRSEHDWMWSAEILGRRGEATAEHVLLEGLMDGYAGVRQTAQWALDQIETPEKTRRAGTRRTRFDPKPLLRAQAREKDANKRAEIILSLGRIGGARVWRTLLSLLDDEQPVVRQAALRALERCPDPDAIEPLMHWLTAPGVDSEDRNLAGMALGLIASDAAVDALIAYVGGDADPPMSASALALGYTRDPRGADVLIQCASRPGRGGGVLKGYAFMGLARLGTPDGVDAILKHRSQYDNTARSIAHAAMRQAGLWSQSAVDRFTELVRSGHAAAPHGLELAEDPRAVDALVEQLPASEKSRRMRIMQSLGRIGDPKATTALIEVMNTSKSVNDQYQAMRALRWRWYWHRPDVQAAIAKHPVFRALVEPIPSLEEQPENTWVLRRWPVDLDDERSCANSYEAGMVFDESTGRIMKWGAHGSRCDSPQTPDTWLYDTGRNIWRESRSPVQPFGSCGTWGMAHDKAARATVSVQTPGGTHGWQWQRARSMRASSPWVYHGEKDIWVPMQPIESSHGPGMRGFHTLAYHDRAQVVMLYGGQWGNNNHGDQGDQGWVYDTYANRWTQLDVSDPLPGKRAHHGLCYLPCVNRILMVGGSYYKADKITWLYDMENNTWTDASPEGDTPRRQPAVYDPITKSALWFGTHVETGTSVRQYDPAVNAWRDIPPPVGMAPRHRSTDVVYDPNRNVFVMDGGHLSWDAGHIAVRETWTYKFRNREPESPAESPAPSRPDLQTADGAVVRISWETVPDAAGYNVYRGHGPQPWTLAFEKANRIPIETPEFSETAPTNAGVLHYAVAAVDARGKEGPRSMTVRAQPALVRDVVASPLPDRTVHIGWEPARAPDVIGYHVYGSTIDIGSMHPVRLFRKIRPLERLTENPIQTTEFTDTRPLEPTEGEFSHEIRAYTVHAVNAWHIESGPSAMVLTLPSSTPGVNAQEMPDGTTLVQWQAAPEKAIQGYRLYRMDEFNRSLIRQINYVPVQGTRYVDVPELPRSERRRYYVVTVNALGEEGLPSTGAYAFGRP